jgi:site-specific recombinase XerD
MGGRLAQLVELLLYTEGVGGSSPSAPILLQNVKRQEMHTCTPLLHTCTPEEYAAKEGVNRTTVVRRLKAGKLAGHQIEERGQLVWRVHLNAPTSGLEAYKAFLKKWSHAQETGFYGNKPLSPRTIEGNTHGLKCFWRFSGLEPDLSRINAANLEAALVATPHDREAKCDHFATKEKMHRAVTSAAKLLIKQGKLAASELEAIKTLLPRPVYDRVVTTANLEQVKALLEFNANWTAGRTAYDAHLTRAVVCIFAFAGLRRDELANLRLEDWRRKEGVLVVTCGKGGKGRLVPCMPILTHALEAYSTVRPASPWLVCGSLGQQMAGDVLHTRISRLAKKAGLKLSPHGLRSACAGILSAAGVPVAMIQRVLGHSSLKTTEGYLRLQQADLNAVLHGLRV